MVAESGKRWARNAFLVLPPLCLALFRAWPSYELNYKWASSTLPTWQLFYHHQDAFLTCSSVWSRTTQLSKTGGMCTEYLAERVFWCFISNRRDTLGWSVLYKGLWRRKAYQTEARMPKMEPKVCQTAYQNVPGDVSGRSGSLRISTVHLFILLTL